jgi:sulfate transport system ATP-binding protein
MYIELKNINKTFGNYQASKDVSFGIEKGSLIGLLGPSGSGKTTILRMIAGLEHQDSGDIYIDGRLVNDFPSNEREIGFVFQNYALFPYFTVYDNIAYGLRVQKKSKVFIKERVEELLELIGLPDVAKRYPTQLSGGQKQRVAFARALAPNPQLLLLDEPFAAIDAKVRKELRTWLREMITRIGITSIFVTHDQEEAVEVADEIIITNEGRVEQVGRPVDIYQQPKTPFVAQFIGQSTVIEDYGRLNGFTSCNANEKAVIRKEFVEVFKEGESDRYQSALEDGVVERLVFRGSAYEAQINVKGITFFVNYPLNSTPIEQGEKVKVFISQLYTFVDDENGTTSLLKNDVYNEKDLFYI